MLYKGFRDTYLEHAFSVRFEDDKVIVPYFNRNGSVYRQKAFGRDGQPLLWLGENKPQVPYGLETIRYGGQIAFLTEGESCAWELRTAYPTTPVLGLPGASSWQPSWAELLADFPVVYLSFDADAAGDGRWLPGKPRPQGRSLLDTVWPSLPWARRVKLPDGLDTRDVFQLHGGLDAYERLLREADYIAGCTRFILETPARVYQFPDHRQQKAIAA